MKALIIIPAYNEERSIERVVQSVVNAGYDYVVINDGSRDNTAAICEREGFNIVNLPVNLGIGGAVQTGHRYALEHGYDADVQFDGDGQHDATCIAPLLQRLEQDYDLVIGSRFISQENTFKSSTARRGGIAILRAILKMVTHQTITDPTSGFRACGTRAIALFAETYPHDYPEPESIAYAIGSSLRVSEVPVIMHERREGTSSIGIIASAYYMIKVSLAIILTRVSKKREQ